MPHDRSKRPAYQWYVNDARSDEIFMLMSYEQQGIYRALLDHQWIEGSIPADPKDIARLLPQLSVKRFLAVWPLISTKFQSQSDHRLVNAKLAAQRVELSQWIHEQQEKGAKGGKAKARNLANARNQLVVNPTSSSSTSTTGTTSPKNGDVVACAHADMNTSPIFARQEHRNHACCGRVCLNSSQFRQFQQLVSRAELDSDRYVRQWFSGWDDRYQTGDRQNETVGEDPFDFWRQRWAETHPSPTRTAADKPSRHAHFLGHNPHAEIADV